MSINPIQLQHISDHARSDASCQSGEVYMLTQEASTAADSGSFGAWKKRFIILSQSLLFYYNDNKVETPLGLIFLERIYLEYVYLERISLDTPKSTNIEDISELYGFKILCIGVEEPSWSFGFATVKDRDLWLNYIQGRTAAKLLTYGVRDVVKVGTSSPSTKIEKLESRVAELEYDIQRASKKITMYERSSKIFNETEEEQAEVNPYGLQVMKVQRMIRGWIIRRKWKYIMTHYVNSPHADMLKHRNKLMWKFMASEENYVDALQVLVKEIYRPLDRGTQSAKPICSHAHLTAIFLNIESIFLLHTFFLNSLRAKLEQWPIVAFGEIFECCAPLMIVYKEYIRNFHHSNKILSSLIQTNPSFAKFIDTLNSNVSSKIYMSLYMLLSLPLTRLSAYVCILEEFIKYTPPENIEMLKYKKALATFQEVIVSVNSEVSETEDLRAILDLDAQFEGKCPQLFEANLIIIKEGILHLAYEKGKAQHNLRKIVLLNRYLIISTLEKNNKLKTDQQNLGVINLDWIQVKNSNNDDKRCAPQDKFIFSLVVNNSETDGKEISLQCVTDQQKRSWITEIGQQIMILNIQRVEEEKNTSLITIQQQFEGCQDIQFAEDSPACAPIIKAGSPDRLIDLMANPFLFCNVHNNAFLLSYVLFLSPQNLMDSLSKIYLGSSKSADPSQAIENSKRDDLIRQKILYILDQWIVAHSEDFSTQPILEQIKVLLVATETDSFQMEEHCEHLKSIAYRVENSDAMDSDSELYLRAYDFYKQTIVMDEKPQKYNLESLFKYSPNFIAEQLTLIDHVLFCRILPREFISDLTKMKEEIAPNIMKYSADFNRVAYRIVWTIVTRPKLDERVKVIEFWLRVAETFLSLGNFNGFMKIQSAFENSCVYRLVKTWNMISKGSKVLRQRFNTMGDSNEFYKNIVDLMKNSPPPLVPFLIPYISRIVMHDTSTPTKLDNGLINFLKFRQIYMIVSEINSVKEYKYLLAFNGEILNEFYKCPFVDEKTLIKHSIAAEARQSSID